MPVPVLAAVNGVAAGAGANLALCCDMVVATRSASFIQAFSKIGLIPDCAGTWLLPRLVGRAQALGLAMTGDKLPAEEAARIGLIWRCVDDANFAAEVQALAQRLAQMPSRALAETRRAIDAATTLDFDAALVRQSIQLSSVKEVALTKLDVLDKLEKIKICVAYKIGDKTYDYLPQANNLWEKIEPIYEEMPGWQESIIGSKSIAQLPQKARDYVARIEELCGVKAAIISTGAKREETIIVN
jgi:hypothetical protein